MTTGLEMAKALAPRGEDRATFGALKREMHKHAFACLTSHELGIADFKPNL